MLKQWEAEGRQIFETLLKEAHDSQKYYMID